MGYDLMWFACQVATCSPEAAASAIIYEQNTAAMKILKDSGVSIEGMPLPELTPPTQSSEELLAPLDVRRLKEKIAAAMPSSWTLTHDTDRESDWEGKGGGAVQVIWEARYVLGSGYGNFENGFEAVHRALKTQGLIGFDPQTNEKLP